MHLEYTATTTLEVATAEDGEIFELAFNDGQRLPVEVVPDISLADGVLVGNVFYQGVIAETPRAYSVTVAGRQKFVPKSARLLMIDYFVNAEVH